MKSDYADIGKRLTLYEGLVRKTSSMYCEVIGEPFEDCCQMLRMKIFQALGHYDPSRSKMTEKAFVFQAVRNRVKDWLRELEARDRANWQTPAFIDDLAPVAGHSGDEVRDAFELKFMATLDDQAYRDLYEEIPTIPSTLSGQEETIVLMLHLGYHQVDIAKELGITRTQAIEAVKEIRVKFSDWNPGSPVIPSAAPQPVLA